MKSNVGSNGHLGSSAKIFKAIGHTIRIQLIGILRHGDLCIYDIMKVITIPQTSIISHLDILQKYGWVSQRIVGGHKHYRLNIEPHNEILCASIMTCLASYHILQEDYKKMTFRLEKNKETSSIDRFISRSNQER